MAEVSIRATNGQAVAAEMASAGQRTSVRLLATVRHFGQLLQTRVKANASTGHHQPGLGHIPGTGPGPNVATGDYVRSITLELSQAPGGTVVATVGTNAAQGRRLEFGFHGTDSRNRHYNQAPFPHFGPALDSLAAPFVAAVTDIAEHP